MVVKTKKKKTDGKGQTNLRVFRSWSDGNVSERKVRKIAAEGLNSPEVTKRMREQVEHDSLIDCIKSNGTKNPSKLQSAAHK